MPVPGAREDVAVADLGSETVRPLVGVRGVVSGVDDEGRYPPHVQQARRVRDWDRPVDATVHLPGLRRALQVWRKLSAHLDALAHLPVCVDLGHVVHTPDGQQGAKSS